MSNKAVRVLGLVVFSVAYWLAALVLLGVMQMGDCIDAAACARSKDATSIIILVVAAAIYALVLHFNSRSRSK